MTKSTHNSGRKKPSATGRASQHAGFSLNVEAAVLRDLMTEQSRTVDGYVTHYSGTLIEFIRAGIPEALFAKHCRRVPINITNHSNHQQSGYLQRRGHLYELTLYWDEGGPWFFSAEHPALSEIARMIHRDVFRWLTGEDGKIGKEVPTQRLRDCAEATEYRLPAHKRFKFGPEIRMEVFFYMDKIYHAIRCAEIMPIESPNVQIQEHIGGNVLKFDRSTVKE